MGLIKNTSDTIKRRVAKSLFFLLVMLVGDISGAVPTTGLVANIYDGTVSTGGTTPMVGAWQGYSYAFSAPPGNATAITILGRNDCGAFIVDNVSVKDGSNNELIVNGAFSGGVSVGAIDSDTGVPTSWTKGGVTGASGSLTVLSQSQATTNGYSNDFGGSSYPALFISLQSGFGGVMQVVPTTAAANYTLSFRMYYQDGVGCGWMGTNATALDSSDTGTITQLLVYAGNPPTGYLAYPSVTTNAAGSVGSTVATLNATVIDNGAATTVTFEYGTASGSYTSLGVVPDTNGSISAGSGTTAVTKALAGLTGSTTYYYRVKAVNSQGTNYGAQQSFTTSAPVYTVTFNGNGNTGGSMSPQTASISTALTSNSFIRSGYTFAGWSTSAGGSVAYSDGASYSFAADVTLYAQWTSNACPQGSYSATGNLPCTTAPAGTYVGTTGATSATNCPAGTYNPSTGSTSPAACQTSPVGTYSPAGSPSSTNCAIGTYNPVTGGASSAACLLAPAGKYVSTTGASSATSCLAGTYNPNTGSTSAAACIATPAGSFSAAGASSATACAAGTFSASAGSASCTPAPAGSFVGSTGATSATQCAAGSFSSSTGSVACTPAPAGSFVAGTGGTSATQCAAGSYSSSTGSTACTLAPAGSFVPSTGATSATLCPANTTSAAGATSCSAIINGACGALANVGSAFQPSGAGLCSAGSASAVASASPWTWSCAGSNTGTTAQCSAPNGTTATSSGSTRAVLSAGTWAVDLVGTTNGLPNTAGTIGTTGNAKSPSTAPGGFSFPHGLYDFTLTGGTGPATVVLTYPTPLPAGTVYWKYGKTPTNATPGWYQFPGAVFSADRLTITLTLNDGELGDDDAVVNGVISDPGGPGVPAAAIDGMGIPTLSEWSLMLLASLMALFGVTQVRRRLQAQAG